MFEAELAHVQNLFSAHTIALVERAFAAFPLGANVLARRPQTAHRYSNTVYELLNFRSGYQHEVTPDEFVASFKNSNVYTRRHLDPEPGASWPVRTIRCHIIARLTSVLCSSPQVDHEVHGTCSFTFQNQSFGVTMRVLLGSKFDLTLDFITIPNLWLSLHYGQIPFEHDCSLLIMPIGSLCVSRLRIWTSAGLLTFNCVLPQPVVAGFRCKTDKIALRPNTLIVAFTRTKRWHNALHVFSLRDWNSLMSHLRAETYLFCISAFCGRILTHNDWHLLRRSLLSWIPYFFDPPTNAVSNIILHQSENWSRNLK